MSNKVSIGHVCHAKAPQSIRKIKALCLQTTQRSFKANLCYASWNRGCWSKSVILVMLSSLWKGRVEIFKDTLNISWSKGNEGNLLKYLEYASAFTRRNILLMQYNTWPQKIFICRNFQHFCPPLVANIYTHFQCLISRNAISLSSPGPVVENQYVFVYTRMGCYLMNTTPSSHKDV